MDRVLCVVPAQPGWMLGEACRGDKGEIVELTWVPVVAWLTDYIVKGPYDFDTTAIPITVEFLPSEYVLKSPEGQLIEPENRQFSCEAEVIEEWRESENRMNELRGKRNA